MSAASCSSVSLSERSPQAISTAAPERRQASATSSSRTALRACRMSFVPGRARCLAIAAPTPLEAPVTKQVCVLCDMFAPSPEQMFDLHPSRSDGRGRRVPRPIEPNRVTHACRARRGAGSINGSLRRWTDRVFDDLRRFGRRIGDELHNLVDGLAGGGIGFEPGLLRVALEIGIVGHCQEGRAQGLQTIGGKAGRRHDRARHAFQREESFERPSIGRCPAEVAAERNVGQIRLLLHAGLEQQGDLVVAQKIGLARLDVRPRPVGIALDFAAFHGEQDGGGRRDNRR